MLRCRLAAIMAIATTSAGNEVTTIRQVTSIVQQNTGIRSMAIPGARRRKIVARIDTESAIADRVASVTPIAHRSSPTPGE